MFEQRPALLAWLQGRSILRKTATWVQPEFAPGVGLCGYSTRMEIRWSQELILPGSEVRLN